MSLFQTLSTIFNRSTQPTQGDYFIPPQIDTQIPDAEKSSAGRVGDDESFIEDETPEDNSAAQAAAEELISAAKQKAADILTQANSDAEFLERSGKQELAHLKLQIEEINLELTKQQKNLTIQDIIVTKKTKNVDALQQRKQTLDQNILDLDQQ